MVPTPTPADRFTFGLWTVGWKGQRPVRRRHPARRSTRSSRCTGSPSAGAAGVTFHDDDLVPFGVDRPASATSTSPGSRTRWPRPA